MVQYVDEDLIDQNLDALGAVRLDAAFWEWQKVTETAEIDVGHRLMVLSYTKVRRKRKRALLLTFRFGVAQRMTL